MSIILPTYNEKKNIGILIPRIEEEFKNVRHEIIVVDDNSPDHTANVVLELNDKYGNIRLDRRTVKSGIGAALRHGYNYATGTFILSSDSDLSFSTADMLRLYNKINEGFDLVIGCRHGIKGSYYDMKGFRTSIKGFISRFGNCVLRLLSGINISDFSANFRAIRKEKWEKLCIEQNTNIMLIEMIIKAKYHGMKITQVPVSFKDRLYGKSKLNLFIEIPKAMLNILFYLVKYRGIKNAINS